MKNLIYLILFAYPVYSFCQAASMPDTVLQRAGGSAHFTKTDFPATFKAHLASAPMMPDALLHLNRFSARAYHVSVLLTWAVSSPQSTRGFIIERAQKGSGWERVGAVAASEGQQEFSFWDVRVQPGAAYHYRLRSQSLTAGVQQSQPVSLTIDSCLDEYLFIICILGFIGYSAYQATLILN